VPAARLSVERVDRRLDLNRRTELAEVADAYRGSI
jgi:hypothetical protein